MIVPPELAGLRLDQALAALSSGLSRRKARAVIAAGRVRVGGRICRKQSHLTSAGERLDVVAQAEDGIWPDDRRPKIVALEAAALVLDKPPGVAVQPGRDPAMLDLLRWARGGHAPELGPDARLWVVHRLDVPASGLVVLARTRPEAARLSALFAEGRAHRCYRARLKRPPGPPGAPPILVDAPLLKRAGRAEVSQEGRTARTLLTVLGVGPEGCDVELRLETGRFHQIRAHLAYLGTPILGDRRYGGAPAARLFLHASHLELPRPDGGISSYVSEPPWAVKGP